MAAVEQLTFGHEPVAVRAAKGRAAFDTDEDTQIVLVHLIQVNGEAAC